MEAPGRRNIDWDKSMSVIVQALHAAGYKDTAKRLASDKSSTIQPFEQLGNFRTQFMGGFWERCTETLLTIPWLSEDQKHDAILKVLQTWLKESETWGRNLDGSDIMHCRNYLPEDYLNKVTSRNVPTFSREFNVNSFRSDLGLRKTMLKELEGRLSPQVPKLVGYGISSQINACHFHNRKDVKSLYCDHSCPKDHFPTKTIQILTTHKQPITCMKFSNNGWYLATGADSVVILWEVPVGWELRIRHILEDHIWPISCVSWSPSDDFILTCSPPEHIKIWDVLTGQCLKQISEGAEVLRSCAFLMSDQNQIVYGKSTPPVSIHLWGNRNNPGAVLKSFPLTDGQLNVEFDVTPNKEKLIYLDKAVGTILTVKHINNVAEEDANLSEKGEISGFIVSRDSQKLIVNMRNDEIHVWDLNRLKRRPLTYWGFTHVISGTVSSCFGGFKNRFLATGTQDSKVCIWNRGQASPIAILEGGHTSAVRHVDWNPGRPQMLASAGDDNTISIWGPQNLIFRHN